MTRAASVMRVELTARLALELMLGRPHPVPPLVEGAMTQRHSAKSARSCGRLDRRSSLVQLGQKVLMCHLMVSLTTFARIALTSSMPIRLVRDRQP